MVIKEGRGRTGWDTAIMAIPKRHAASAMVAKSVATERTGSCARVAKIHRYASMGISDVTANSAMVMLYVSTSSKGPLAKYAVFPVLTAT